MQLATITIDKLTHENIEDALVQSFQAVIANGIYGRKVGGGCAYRVYQRNPDGSSKPQACCVVGAMLTDEFVNLESQINDGVSVYELSHILRHGEHIVLEPALVDHLAFAQEIHDTASNDSSPPSKEAFLDSWRENSHDYKESSVVLLERVLNRL